VILELSLSLVNNPHLVGAEFIPFLTDMLHAANANRQVRQHSARSCRTRRATRVGELPLRVLVVLPDEPRIRPGQEVDPGLEAAFVWGMAIDEATPFTSRCNEADFASSSSVAKRGELLYQRMPEEAEWLD
jgi:hypothetical protein